MDNKFTIIIGIILIVLGFAFFIDRGYFANLFLDAAVLGNIGFNSNDTTKVNGVAIVGGLSFLVGVVLTITGVYKKKVGE